ncbi:Fanconi anemia group M protein isoform X2 [Cucumis melo var. makuwa]|uniref:Fanconi anemia group M protein isoform X2 n=1 Tax=Cucumis melo var. makuwa TaxID=1194695 RepID=A0A5D3E465_CUCMM|nr:Fanconi anemia group M protein isoform X2 [Cucumis melo var. makuwa]
MRFDDIIKHCRQEAEVSSDATISRDDDDPITSLFDIFIDDGVNASAPSPQDETSRPDMLLQQ